MFLRSAQWSSYLYARLFRKRKVSDKMNTIMHVVVSVTTSQAETLSSFYE